MLSYWWNTNFCSTNNLLWKWYLEYFRNDLITIYSSLAYKVVSGIKNMQEFLQTIQWSLNVWAHKKAIAFGEYANEDNCSISKAPFGCSIQSHVVSVFIEHNHFNTFCAGWNGLWCYILIGPAKNIFTFGEVVYSWTFNTIRKLFHHIRKIFPFVKMKFLKGCIGFSFFSYFKTWDCNWWILGKFLKPSFGMTMLLTR